MTATHSSLQTDVDEARHTVSRLEADYDEALADPGMIQEDRDSLRLLVESARFTLTSAQRALDRFERGQYGICAKCGEPIAPERLEALPDSVTCRSCSA